MFFVPVCGGSASCCPFASIFCVFSAFTVQRDGLLKRAFVIVNWIGVVVTRCDRFGWYSDGSCRGSCDWAVAGEAVTGLFLLLVKVVCLCILRVLDWRFRQRDKWEAQLCCNGCWAR